MPIGTLTKTMNALTVSSTVAKQLYSFPLAYGPTTSASRAAQAKVLRADFGDGYSQRAADGINTVRDTYTLSWENITRTEAQTCDTFFRARGGYEAFWWTAPGQSQKKWICSDWQVRHSTATLDSLSATFVEVFDQ